MSRPLFDVNDRPSKDLAEVSTEQLRSYRITYKLGITTMARKLESQNPLADVGYLERLTQTLLDENPLYEECRIELTRRDREEIPF